MIFKIFSQETVDRGLFIVVVYANGIFRAWFVIASCEMTSLADLPGFALALIVVSQIDASRPIGTRGTFAEVSSNLSFAQLAIKPRQTVTHSLISDLVAVGTVQAIFLIARIIQDFAKFSDELGRTLADGSFVDNTAYTAVEARRN